MITMTLTRIVVSPDGEEVEYTKSYAIRPKSDEARVAYDAFQNLGFNELDLPNNGDGYRDLSDEEVEARVAEANGTADEDAEVAPKETKAQKKARLKAEAEAANKDAK